MTQSAAGPLSVPQGPFTPNEQYLNSKIAQLETIVAGVVQHDIGQMSPGRVALVVGGTVVVMAGVGFATAAIYDRAKNGRSNQPKQLK